MNVLRTPAAAGALVAAIISVAPAAGVAGCALTHPGSAGQRGTVTLTLDRDAPCALAAILDRGPATLVRSAFETMVTATATPGEHLIVIDAGSGRLLGSFVVPLSPAMAVPAPPAPLPETATSFQRAQHRTALLAYRAAVDQDLTRLRGREQAMLSQWTAMVLAKVAEGNGLGLDPSRASLAPALDSTVADFTSLEQSVGTLGSHKVVAVLGLAGLRDSVPALTAGLGGASVVVTGFPPNSDLQRAWRSELGWEGAARVTLLTRATIDELPAVVGRDLAGTPPPLTTGRR